MVTAEEQPPFVYRDDFERRSAEFDRRFNHIDDDLRELRQNQKDLAQGQKELAQELNGVKQEITVLAQEQKALGQRFGDFKENVDRRITMLTWLIALFAVGNFAMFGWVLSRLP